MKATTNRQPSSPSCHSYDRSLASFEAMGGLILFGTSTAFLFAMTRRLLEPKIDSLNK